MSENGEIYTAGKKIYTAAGSDGSANLTSAYHMESFFFLKSISAHLNGW